MDPLIIYPDLVDLRFKAKTIVQGAHKIHLKYQLRLKFLVNQYFKFSSKLA